MSKKGDVVVPKPILVDRKNPVTAGFTESDQLKPKPPVKP